jgi:hypothetical protein
MRKVVPTEQFILELNDFIVDIEGRSAVFRGEAA